MRYFGGKQRISKPLAAFLNSQLKPGQAFYDMFCGSCNVISKIDPNRDRIANDLHKELIAMWRYVQQGGELPDEHKAIPNAVLAYQSYLNSKFVDWQTRIDKKQMRVTWTKRPVPVWYKGELK